MLSALLASTLIPAGVDLLKGIFTTVQKKVTGITVEDELKIKAADTEQLKALAQLDAPGGTPSGWVINLRAAFRYIASIIVIFVGLFIASWGIYDKNQEVITMGMELIGMPCLLIFGERMHMTLKGK